MSANDLRLYPYQLPGFDKLEAPPDAAWIRKARRRINAEFELGDGLSIEFQGIQCDRASLLALLEELEDAEKADFYFHLSQNDKLCAFLDNGDLRNLKKEPFPEEMLQGSGKEFFSDLFLPAVGKSAVDALKHENYGQILILPKVLDQLNSFQKDVVLQLPGRFVHSLIRDLEDLSGGSASIDDIRNERERFNQHRMRAFNLLGEDFKPKRNLLAVAIHGLCVALNNQHQEYKLANILCRNALLLKVDHSLQESLQKLEELTRRNSRRVMHKPVSGQERGGGRGCLSTVLILISIILVTRACNRIPYYDEAVYIPNFPQKEDLRYQPPARTRQTPLQKTFARLMAYELKRGFSKDQFKKLTLRPATGDRLYPDLYPEIPKSGLRPQSLILENKGNKDLVVFVESVLLEDHSRHAYLRKGSNLLIDSLSHGAYSIYLYAGDNPGYWINKSGDSLFVWSRDMYLSLSDKSHSVELRKGVTIMEISKSFRLEQR